MVDMHLLRGICGGIKNEHVSGNTGSSNEGVDKGMSIKMIYSRPKTI